MTPNSKNTTKKDGTCESNPNPDGAKVLRDYKTFGQIQEVTLPQNGQEAVFDIYAVKMADP